MGKRQRRRDRRQPGDGAGAAAGHRVVLPSSGVPWVEVRIAAGATAAERELCLAYWEFAEPGVWARPVAALGEVREVVQVVKTRSRAFVLTLECPRCGLPLAVATRSDLAETMLWHPGLFPRKPRDTRSACGQCDTELEAARALDAARELERRECLARERAAAADRLAAEATFQADDADEVDEVPGPEAALVLLAMSEVVTGMGVESFGPLERLTYTLTGTRRSDGEAVRALHARRWIVPVLPAVGDGVFGGGPAVEGLSVGRVAWRPADTLVQEPVEPGGPWEDAGALAWLVLAEEADWVRGHLEEIEAGLAVAYIEGLLTRKYHGDPIPDHRRPDARAIALDALRAGFTLKQVLALAWRAAADSVAWGRRTRGVKPAGVSAAAVTAWERQVSSTGDRPVDEYELPGWLDRPAVHATACRFLGAYERLVASDAAVERFRGLLEHADGPPPKASEQAAARPDVGPDVEFAVVFPDGTLELRTADPGEMEVLVGARSGSPGQVVLEQAPFVAVFMSRVFDRADVPENPVAAAMLGLFGAWFDRVDGNVVFAQTDLSGRFFALQPGVRELIETAHEVGRIEMVLDAEL